MLTMDGGLVLSRRFCMAIRPPNVALVLPQDATTMAALGAAALAHSASAIASPSSLFTPGARQFVTPLDGSGWTVVSEAEGYFDSPNVERKVVQSSVL